MTEKNDNEQKYIFYLNDSKTIVLTDEDPDFDPRATYLKISKILSANKITLFETKKDFLIVKPKDIKAVQISLNKDVVEFGDLTAYESPKKVAKEIIDETNTEDYIDDEEYDLTDIPDFPIEDDSFEEEDELDNYDENYEKEFKNLTISTDKFNDEDVEKNNDEQSNTNKPLNEDSDIIYEEGMSEVKFKNVNNVPVKHHEQLATDGVYKDLDSEGMKEVDDDFEYFKNMGKDK